MKLEIDIDKSLYDYVKNMSFVENEDVVLKQSVEDRIKTLALIDILNAVKNGKPLEESRDPMKLFNIW